MSGIRGMRNPRVDFGHSWCPISQTRFNTHIRPIHYSRRKVGLPEQLSLFADRSSRPKGLRYAEEFVSPAAEKTLIRHIAAFRCSLSSSANARQTPRGVVRISIRLHVTPARGGRSHPRVAGIDRREFRAADAWR